MKQKTENRKPITSQLFGVPISITSKDQALALILGWVKEWRTANFSEHSENSDSRTVRLSDDQTIRQTDKQINRQMNSRFIRLSDNPIIRSSGSPSIPSVLKIITTPNPEMIVAAQRDPEFLRALQSADLAIPDGIGIIWALKLLGYQSSVVGYQSKVDQLSVSQSKTGKLKTGKLETENGKPKTDNWPPSRLSGLNLMGSLIALAAQKGWRVMLVGGKPGIAEKATEKLQLSVLGYQLSGSSQSVVGLSVAETDEQKTGKPETENRKQKTDNRLQIKSLSGPQDIEKASPHERNDLLNSINSFSPDLLFVAFGHGKQEKWLSANRYRLRAGIAMGVGGALDQIADPSLRPPSYIDSIGLGWLYRLGKQPWRWRRQIALGKFVGMLVKEMLKKASRLEG